MVILKLFCEGYSDFYSTVDKNIVDYGILLTFKTGLRPGELAGLQWDDVDGNIIHVRRIEIRYEDEAMWILKEIRKTYCTIPIDAKVDDSLIISQVSHTDIQTTRTGRVMSKR